MQDVFNKFFKKLATLVQSDYIHFMKTFENNEFWNRVDFLLKKQKRTLTDLCKECCINYNSVNGQRTRESLPKAEQIYAMSQYLGTSMEFLLTGVEPNFKLQEPLNSIVEFLKENEDFLDAVCTVCHIKRGGSSKEGAL